jgi:hypothetical protein
MADGEPAATLMLLPYLYWKMCMNVVMGPYLRGAQRMMNEAAETGLDAMTPQMPSGYVG